MNIIMCTVLRASTQYLFFNQIFDRGDGINPRNKVLPISCKYQSTHVRKDPGTTIDVCIGAKKKILNGKCARKFLQLILNEQGPSLKDEQPGSTWSLLNFPDEFKTRLQGFITGLPAGRADFTFPFPDMNGGLQFPE
jgi:hypothetical protein